MIRVVESIATDPAGQGNRRRLHILPGREFRRLAHAVNDMADRTEEHLRTIAENKAQLKTILDVMNEGVLVIGEKGRIRLVNPALVRLFPQAKDAEGKFPVEVIPGGGNPAGARRAAFRAAGQAPAHHAGSGAPPGHDPERAVHQAPRSHP